MVRCVPAPFPPVRDAWLKLGTLPTDDAQILTWVNDQLYLLDHLPRTADGLSLQPLLARLFRVPTWNIVDDQNLLASPQARADFVTRLQAPDWDEAKALEQLATTLRRDLKMPVKLTIRKTERPHVIASGSLLRTPALPGINATVPVAIFGKAPPPSDTPEQRVTLGGLLLAVGDYVGLGVIYEVDSAPPFGQQGGFGGGGGKGGKGKGAVGKGRGPVGRAEALFAGDGQRVLVPERIGAVPRGQDDFDPTYRALDEVPAGSLRIVVRGNRNSDNVDVETVLKRVSEQTGLTLRVENRSVRTLVVQKAD